MKLRLQIFRVFAPHWSLVYCLVSHESVSDSQGKEYFTYRQHCSPGKSGWANSYMWTLLSMPETDSTVQSISCFKVSVEWTGRQNKQGGLSLELRLNDAESNAVLFPQLPLQSRPCLDWEDFAQGHTVREGPPEPTIQASSFQQLGSHRPTLATFWSPLAAPTPGRQRSTI